MAKTAIVTGASRGIGKATAKAFAEQGYNVALISRHHEEIMAAAEEITARGGGLCKGYECDIRNTEQVKAAFATALKEFGSIDVLVNNAGINSRRTLSGDLNADIQGWNDEIATNLTGTYICSRIAAEHMKTGAAIINIASVKGIEPTSSPGYGASKAGVIKLTKDLAKTLAQRGIRVNCIAPGFIDTGMTTELPEQKKQQYKAQIPMARFGSADEVATVAIFLASPAASYITGETINANGGYLMV